MPRTREIPGANISKESFGKYTYWRAWLGKKFTGGKYLQKRFSSYAKAAQWVEEMRQGEEQHGKSIFTLSYGQLSEARSAFERLSEYDVSLSAVVDHWIKFQAPLEVQKTLSEFGKGIHREPQEHRLQGTDSQAVSLLRESNLRGVRFE